jgi:hypothetical protein
LPSVSPTTFGRCASGRAGSLAQDRFRDGRVVEPMPLFDRAGLVKQLDG